jgi:hypothetical protein
MQDELAYTTCILLIKPSIFFLKFVIKLTF